MTAPILPDHPADWFREISGLCEHEFMTDIGKVLCDREAHHEGDHTCDYKFQFRCKQGAKHDYVHDAIQRRGAERDANQT